MTIKMVKQMLKKDIPIRSYSGEKWKTNPTNKKHLAVDFNHRCAYCDDLDKIYGGYTTYHVEHFAPKEKFPKLKITYENLLYACPYCNGSKNDDWPSDSPDINVVGDKGYVDPCTAEYYQHLDRDTTTGEIYAKTALGTYMYNHLKLYLRRHSIIYMLDKLQEKMFELNNAIEKDKANGVDVSKKEAALNLVRKDIVEYYTLIQEVSNTQ